MPQPHSFSNLTTKTTSSFGDTTWLYWEYWSSNLNMDIDTLISMTLFKTITTTFSFLKCTSNWKLVTCYDFLCKVNFCHISDTKSGKSEAHTWQDPGEIPNADWWNIYRFVPNLQRDNLSPLVIHQHRKFQKSFSSQEQHKETASAGSHNLGPRKSQCLIIWHLSLPTTTASPRLCAKANHPLQSS